MIMHLLLIQRILKEVKKITCHLGKCLIGLTFSLLISVLLILIILRVFMDYWMTNEQMCDVEIIKTNLVSGILLRINYFLSVFDNE